MNTLMKKVVLAGALIAAASSVSAQTTDQSDASPSAYNIQETGEDQRITNDVEAKIAGDPLLTGTIGVETVNGVVTLTGLVSTSGEADRAGRDAESVDGVREVDDQVNALVGKNF
jgi:osmotically-inducible protein OsmY